MVYKVIVKKGKISLLSPKSFRTRASANIAIKKFKKEKSRVFRKGFRPVKIIKV